MVVKNNYLVTFFASYYLLPAKKKLLVKNKRVKLKTLDKSLLKIIFLK